MKKLSMLVLALALLGFICLGFPVMKRVDRFLNENLKPEIERPQSDGKSTGKKNQTML